MKLNNLKLSDVFDDKIPLSFFEDLMSEGELESLYERRRQEAADDSAGSRDATDRWYRETLHDSWGQFVEWGDQVAYGAEDVDDPDVYTMCNPRIRPVNAWYARWKGERVRAYDERMVRYAEHTKRIDREQGVPLARSVRAVLVSGVDLDVKKAAVVEYMNWVRKYCTPEPLVPGPERFGWPGRHLDSVSSYDIVIKGEHWERYQRELAQAREARRAPRTDRVQEFRARRAQKWLAGWRERFLAARCKGQWAVDRLMAQLEKRLATLPADAAAAYRKDLP